MQANFSEFTYGFALSHELVSTARGSLIGAPVFPSLIDEGKYGGFDVKIEFMGFPLFLQFKLSEYMTRSSAEQWWMYNSNYYRMRLMPLRYSQQHSLLLNWETCGNLVYYAAPAFHLSDEMNKNFLNSTIVENSMFFLPSEIGPLPDGNDHCITFIPKENHGFLWSEPKKINITYGKEFINNLQKFRFTENSNNIRPVEINRDYFKKLNWSIISFVSQYKDFSDSIKHRIAEMPEVLKTVFLSRALLECEFLMFKAEI